MKTTARAIVLKQLPKLDVNAAEELLQALLHMAQRQQSSPAAEHLVLMTMQQNFYAHDIFELFQGSQGDRISARGIVVLIELYRSGFFTGYGMNEPKMVSRIGQFMQQVA
jgi:hypothetical protein